MTVEENIFTDNFIKIAKRLFDPRRAPIVKKEVKESFATAESVNDTVFKRNKNVASKKSGYVATRS